MMYLCEFTWHAGTSEEEVWQRILQQHQAGKNNPDRIKGWYTFAGGGAGFLLVDYDDPRQLTQFLQPYMDLVAFDVRAVYPIDYQQALQRAGQQYGSSAGGGSSGQGGRPAGGGPS